MPSETAELTFIRTFHAPRSLVFKMWIDPKHFEQWWGPHQFTNPVCRLNAVTGGSIYVEMRGPGGDVYPMSGTFNEIIPPEKIVFTSTPLDGNKKPMFETITTVIFTEQHGMTTLTLHTRVAMSTSAAAPHLAGMNEGWTQSLERLDEIVKKNVL